MGILIVPIITRSFLLLLLAVDWACDTSFGTNIFAEAMTSSPALCVRVVGRDELNIQPVTPTVPTSLADLGPSSFSPQLVSMMHETYPPFLVGTERIYVFMAILR
jgi:hypothetical protein